MIAYGLYKSNLFFLVGGLVGFGWVGVCLFAHPVGIMCVFVNVVCQRALRTFVYLYVVYIGALRVCVCLYVCLMFIYLSTYLSVYASVCLAMLVYIFACVSVCMRECVKVFIALWF